MRQQSRNSKSRNRRSGRALVECIVAIFLLSITALSMAATVRGTLALADDATLITRAQSLATSGVEDALTGACATALSGTVGAPRINALWVQTGSAHHTSLHLDLTLDRSPIAFAGNTPMLFGIEAGGVCP